MATFVQEVAGGACATRDATVGTLIDIGSSSPRPTSPPRRSAAMRRASGATSSRRSATSRSPIFASPSSTYAQLRTGGNRFGRPLATATIRQVHAVLRRALQQGVKWGWLQSKPAVLASPPRVRNPPIEAPEPTVVTRLIEKVVTTTRTWLRSCNSQRLQGLAGVNSVRSTGTRWTWSAGR